jgi:hypothetical protein
MVQDGRNSAILDGNQKRIFEKRVVDIAIASAACGVLYPVVPATELQLLTVEETAAEKITPDPLMSEP